MPIRLGVTGRKGHRELENFFIFLKGGGSPGAGHRERHVFFHQVPNGVRSPGGGVTGSWMWSFPPSSRGGHREQKNLFFFYHQVPRGSPGADDL
jgi:hypothetical protein